MKKLLVLCLSVGIALPAEGQAHFRHHGWYTLPDSVMTPGDTLTSDTAVICHRKTSGVRSVSKQIHNLAHSKYGTKETDSTKYEVDHLISLELGGSNSIKNLWPQIYPEAYEKDRVEDELHRLVCQGKMNLRQAQVGISRDWVVLRDWLSNSHVTTSNRLHLSNRY